MLRVTLAALTTTLLSSALPPGAAEAGPTCAPHEVVRERLGDRYGETRVSMGLGANNAVVEVFASEDSGTWTITITSAEGVTCLMASGQAYEPMSESLPVKGSEL